MKRLSIIIICVALWMMPLHARFLCNNSETTMLVDSAAFLLFADTAQVHQLNEVVVISQPKEFATLRQQPLSSSAITYREMNLLGVRDLSELSKYVPSFVMPQYGSRLTSSIYIRGIGSRVNSPVVGIYMDGMPLVNKAAFNFHSYELERVEILRGPQGTLYGMNTEGGLVRMYSKNPLTHQGTDVHLGAGSHFYRNVEVAHYNKVNNALYFSIAGFYNGQNGFLKNVTTGRRADAMNEAGGKLRLLFMPTERLTFDLIADYQFIRQNGFSYGKLNIANNKVEAPAGNRDNTYQRNMLNTALNIGFKADAFLLNATTSYQFLKDGMNMDQDYLVADYMHLKQNQFVNGITQELSLKRNTHGAWQWTAGVFASKQWLKTIAPVFFDGDFTQRIASPVRTAIYNSIVSALTQRFMAQGLSQATAEVQAAATVERAGGVSMEVAMEVPAWFRTPQFNLGFYHESNLHLSERITATLGLRYDYNHVGIDYNAKAAMSFNASVMGQEQTNVLSSTLINNTHDDYNQLLPKIGLIYTLSKVNGSNVYATFCKGYRIGGYNIQMFSDILQTELNNNSQLAMQQSYDIPHDNEDYEKVNKTISYKPEESWNYELGAHLNLLGNRLHVDFATYYMRVTNQQLSVMAGNYGFGRMMVNIGKSYSCGLETSLRGSAINNKMTWAVNYGLTHAEFKNYSDEIDGITTDYKGKLIPFIPKHTLSAYADYRINICNQSVSFLKFGVDFSAQGRTYWDEANTYYQPFYALLGAYTILGIKNINLKLWCRNLTNTHYNTFAFDSSASGSKEYFAQRGTPFQLGFDLNLYLK